MSDERAEVGEVTLPPDVVERIEARLPRTAYESVDEYAVVALRGLLREAAVGPEGTGAGGTVPRDERAAAEEDLDDDLAERLESLGYR